MNNGVAFIGGIHGVGKSTICQHICRELNLEYLSASELLKWKDISDDSKNKKVKDIPDTQNRLVHGLSNIVREGKYYLLDGHYCLLNNNNRIENVPIETFNQINPFSLNIILGDISVIKRRLEERDKIAYNHELLERLQSDELEYAKFLARTLGITLNIGTQKDYSELLTSLNDSLMYIKTRNDY